MLSVDQTTWAHERSLGVADLPQPGDQTRNGEAVVAQCDSFDGAHLSRNHEQPSASPDWKRIQLSQRQSSKRTENWQSRSVQCTL
jgi:hypothetical protein